MDCIDLFKKAAMALQTDPRYLELDAARRENDSDQELQNLIGEFNLARLDLNNEAGKPEPDTARTAELNKKVNDLYSQIMSSEGMVRYNTAKAEVLRDHLLLRDKCDELDDARFHQQEKFDEWEKLSEEQERLEAEEAESAGQ